jgi:hypothetical protein
LPLENFRLGLGTEQRGMTELLGQGRCRDPNLQLKDYSTAGFGKKLNVPGWHSSAAGPFDPSPV